MAGRITIQAGRTQFQAQLNDTATARAILEALPLSAWANRWGEEIYFSISVDQDLEDGAREVLQAGELGYWPPGNALCIFFGPTPASERDEIRAASPVNIIGRIEGDLDGLRSVRDGEKVLIQPASIPFV